VWFYLGAAGAGIVLFNVAFVVSMALLARERERAEER
jgi:hypothetical protein